MTSLKFRKLLVKYQEANSNLIDQFPNEYDWNTYDIDGYWAEAEEWGTLEENWKFQIFEDLKFRVKAVQKLVDASQLLNDFPTRYA